MLDSQMLGRSVRTTVPDSLYCECKTLYMMSRRPQSAAAQPRLIAPARLACKRFLPTRTEKRCSDATLL